MTWKIKDGYAMLIDDGRNKSSVYLSLTIVDTFNQRKETFEASVPAGASTGEKEKRLIDSRQAVEYLNTIIIPYLKNSGTLSSGLTEADFDRHLNGLEAQESTRMPEGTFGANAILPASMVLAQVSAFLKGYARDEFFMYFIEDGNEKMPVPMLNLLNGGKHAEAGEGAVPIQEIMIVPVGAKSFAEAMDMRNRVWFSLRKVMKERGMHTGRFDEGGFANSFRSVEKALDCLSLAIEKAGLKVGTDIALAFDGAFSEIHGKGLHDEKADAADKTYHLGKQRLTSDQMVKYWENVVRQYPSVLSIEDGMGERDTEGWKSLTQALGSKVLLVLDDFTCTNPTILKIAIENGLGNSLLAKTTQIGTVSGNMEATSMAKKNGYCVVQSHRSGEVPENQKFLAAISMHTNVDFIKNGSSGDRNIAYNELRKIEMALERMGRKPAYLGLDAAGEGIGNNYRMRNSLLTRR